MFHYLRLAAPHVADTQRAPDARRDPARPERDAR
jgi:hypothetical protein